MAKGMTQSEKDRWWESYDLLKTIMAWEDLAIARQKALPASSDDCRMWQDVWDDCFYRWKVVYFHATGKDLN